MQLYERMKYTPRSEGHLNEGDQTTSHLEDRELDMLNLIRTTDICHISDECFLCSIYELDNQYSIVLNRKQACNE